ncbi:MAG: hypothetical protein ABJH20_15750 [Rhizobiaceae bacterium]
MGTNHILNMNVSIKRHLFAGYESPYRDVIRHKPRPMGITTTSDTTRA